jgi:preprotein translocase subunit SecA
LTRFIEKIKEFEKSQENYTLDDVKAKTIEFKALFEGLDFMSKEDTIKIKNILSEIRFEAFALVKTTAKLIYGQSFTLKDGRDYTWNMIPYDVQLVG